MKTTLFDKSGKKKSEVELPKIFNTKIREDIVLKYFEADKFVQPYSHDPRAGRKHSASGTISHKRHDWKGHYGRGISRIPRKTMSRRGTQFVWVGAEASSTRGGRRVHGPKGIGAETKINKKEIKLAMNSAFAATADKDCIIARYGSLDKISIAPIIIESIPEKTKDLKLTLESAFAESKELVFKKKSVRAGKGKSRGRKYKSNAGALIVVGKDEEKRFKGIEIKSIDEVTIADLYPLGRLTVYTQKAIAELGGKK